jgi:hypothetical protein
VTPEEPIGDGEEQNTSPRPFRGQSIEGETPDLTREAASEPHTVMQPPHHDTSSETLRLQSLPEPSDAAEDSSAYAETLEGGSSGKHGVPFYPGMCLLFGLPSPLGLITRGYFRHY